jgi:endonuclease G, mitochondrial
MAHLPQTRIQEVQVALLSLPLTYDSPTRAALFTGINAQFVALLPTGLPPAIQLLSDLGRLNAIERLSDGTVPLEIWLSNAGLLAGPTEAAKVFHKASNDIECVTSGSPRLDLGQLPELKEVFIHENDLVSFSFMQRGLEAARSVAKLLVPRHENGQKVLNPDPVIFLGTGWLLTPRLLVTNHHVINARRDGEAAAPPGDFTRQGETTTVKFDFDAEDVAGVDAAVQAVEAWNESLDYAVLRLSDTGRAPLRLASGPLQKTDKARIPVNVIQHPQGFSKKYGIRNNLVSATTATDVRYFTDTDSGSSGSPVFDDGWKVVALHRGATYADGGLSFQGRSTAYVNIGTQVQAILSDLRARYPALAAEL